MASYANGLPAFLGIKIMYEKFISSAEGEANPLDFKNIYLKLDEDLTREVDSMLLSEYGLIGNSKILTSNRQIQPGVGTHYYYMNKAINRSSFYAYKYITLRKKVSQSTSGGNSHDNNNSNHASHYYVLIFSRFTKDVFDKFCNKLFKDNEQCVKCIDIDTSNYKFTTALIRRSVTSPYYDRQKKAIKYIFDWFIRDDVSNKFNCSVIITGVGGIGKTSMGYILKKEIETGMKGIKDSMPEGFALDVNSLRKANEFKDKCYISLYYNFNPSSPGVNIIKLAVEQATKTNPVIIVINEVDTMYEKVYGVNHADTTRTAHTEDVNTFHSMIDSLVGSPYIITIWTTNKTKEELDANEPNYKNFYRKGRVNFFLHMTAPNPDDLHEGDCIQTLTVPGITNSVGV